MGQIVYFSRERGLNYGQYSTREPPQDLLDYYTPTIIKHLTYNYQSHIKGNT